MFFLTHHQEVVHVEGDLHILLLKVTHAWRSLRLGVTQAPQRLPDMPRPELRGVTRSVQGLDQPLKPSSGLMTSDPPAATP